jgi:hypothetical protein
MVKRDSVIVFGRLVLGESNEVDVGLGMRAVEGFRVTGIKRTVVLNKCTMVPSGRLVVVLSRGRERKNRSRRREWRKNATVV